LQTVLSTLQTVSLTIGVIYYIFIMRNNQRTRELALKAQEQALETRNRQFVMRFIDRTNDAEFWVRFNEVMYHQEWTDPEDFQRRYGPDNPKSYAARASLLNFYNTLGYIFESESLDIGLLYRGFQNHVMRLWEKFQPWINYQRKKSEDPLQYKQFELFYEKIKKYRGLHQELYA